IIAVELARDPVSEDAKENVSTIVVRKLLSRLRSYLLLSHRFDEIVFAMVFPKIHFVVGKLAKTRCVGQEVADSDLVPSSVRLGKVLADGVIEHQLPFFNQNHNAGCSELFAYRTRLKQG